MNTLKNKIYKKFDYLSRYTVIPFYYDTLTGRQTVGIGKNVVKNDSWVAHKIEQTDTLDSLALKYYNNPTLWWAIAYFNDIQDAFINLFDNFDIIKIPRITSISFTEERD